MQFNYRLPYGSQPPTKIPAPNFWVRFRASPEKFVPVDRITYSPENQRYFIVTAESPQMYISTSASKVLEISTPVNYRIKMPQEETINNHPEILTLLEEP